MNLAYVSRCRLRPGRRTVDHQTCLRAFADVRTAFPFGVEVCNSAAASAQHYAFIINTSVNCSDESSV